MIYCVEDEKNIRELLIYTLETTGFSAKGMANAKELRTALKEELPNLILLDIMLPGEDGYSILESLKSSRDTRGIPVIMVTAKEAEYDKVKGLEAGADDYITKPFNPRELTIRARNLLSRTMNLGTVSEERRSVESYKFNGWELDINSRSLIGPDGEQYKLPRSEFRAMLHFCENPGKIQSRAELLKKMTGRELKPHDRTVDVTIRRIRKHFESTPDTPEIIATIHGEGYRFCGDLED